MAGMFWEALERCLKHNTSLLSGALAFYALLSLAPALYFVVAAAGVVIGRRAASGEVIAWATQMIGPAGARFIGGVLDRDRAGSSFTTVAGVVSLFFGSTGAFGALQDALNLVWEVPPSVRSYIKQFFFKRLISFVAVMIVGVLLLVALLVGAVISFAGMFIPQAAPATDFLLQTVGFLVTLVLVTVLFAMLYRILPDCSVAWQDVWTGAAVTALLFSIGKTLIGLYLGHTTTTSPYGAAGSVVVFLLWVYYSAQIFLFGAEFTEVYATARRTRGAAIPAVPLPPPDALPDRDH
ncbi:MAG: ribonuclease [Bryobacterales bacterium]|jgi:membrane protein|nr:ribonuclease [Bryobacterales bacterium]